MLVWHMFKVGWLTHGGFATDVDVDFFAVVEHRLITAGVRRSLLR